MSVQIQVPLKEVMALNQEMNERYLTLHELNHYRRCNHMLIATLNKMWTEAAMRGAVLDAAAMVQVTNQISYHSEKMIKICRERAEEDCTPAKRRRLD